MILFNKGLTYDISGDILNAIKYYSRSLENEEDIAEAYLNLLLIHWLANFDLGFMKEFELNKQNYTCNDSIISDIIEEGKRKFPSNIEFEFWQKYFNSVLGIESFSTEDCKRLVKNYSIEDKVLYFFLYVISDKKEYLAEKEILKKIISRSLTTKNKYILSMLE